MTTKTIRIPVIIDANGKWCAHGYPSLGSHPDWDLMDESADDGEPLVCPQRFWVTAELPLPIVGEVAGKVEGSAW